MNPIASSASRLILLALVGATCAGYLAALFVRSIPPEYAKSAVELFGAVTTTVVGYYIGKAGAPTNGSDPLAGK